MQPLDAQQTKRLLEAARVAGDRLEALWVLAVHAGMRPGELLGLKWEDVDLDGASLRINRALSEGKFTTPKTKKSRRVDLSAAGVAALKAHRRRQNEERLKYAGPWRDQGLVFPSAVGTPLSHHNVVRAFKKLLERADLPETTRLYDLRHTCAPLPQRSRQVRPGASRTRLHSPHPRHVQPRPAQHGWRDRERDG